MAGGAGTCPDGAITSRGRRDGFGAPPCGARIARMTAAASTSTAHMEPQEAYLEAVELTACTGPAHRHCTVQRAPSHRSWSTCSA
eukprot:scaffold15734_cov60-Phaeocystis_antarctica.AAC.1